MSRRDDFRPRDKAATQDRTDRSDRSDPTDPTDFCAQLSRCTQGAQPPRLRPSGGYRRLRSFQTATLIYDATVFFCERFVDKRSRTVDQMVQAARSGRQNIAEGSRASATSSQTELRLVNVARASLDELLLDYEDFLRQRRLPAWTKDSMEAKQARELGLPKGNQELTAPTEAGDRARWALYAPLLEHDDPSVVANTVVCLIHQANYLLDRQIAGLERDFISQGGYSERLAAARIAEREKARGTTDVPDCPLCEKPMTLRTARQGKNAGSKFWGCTGYPECRGTLPFKNSEAAPAAPAAQAAHDLTDPSDPTDRTDRSDRAAKPRREP